MKSVFAYGPEILSLEKSFDNGETVLLTGYARIFLLLDSTIYCNLIPAKNSWVIGRIYDLSTEDCVKFEESYPTQYTFETVNISTQSDFRTARTFTGKLDKFTSPLTVKESPTKTLYTELKTDINPQFSKLFAYSTQKSVQTDKSNIQTSYYSLYPELIDLKNGELQLISIPFNHDMSNQANQSTV